MPDVLSPDAVAGLRVAPLIPAPGDARRFSRSRVLRTGFSAAAEDLMSWRVHERAGLRVSVSSPRVRIDDVVVLTLGRWPLLVKAPCRVVEVVDDPDRIGFAYGTLPGHPEAGLERFLVERRGTDVVFTVEATSRPAGRLARLGGPLTRRVQDAITSRYLRAADG